MWMNWVKLTTLLYIIIKCRSLSSGCPPDWLDCGKGRCLSILWICDGDNDCGNLNDEIGCDNFTETTCPSFFCRDHRCIRETWRCDDRLDCIDGSGEELCPRGKLCTDSEFLCSSGSCVNQSFVCDGKDDCTDGSDEGPYCGDVCGNMNCSQNCRNTSKGSQCYCVDGYALDANDNTKCIDIDECQQDGICSQACINTIGGYECPCQEGYKLVNRTCRAMGAEPLLIFSTVKDLQIIHLRSKNIHLIQYISGQASVVNVDQINEQIYWIEVSNRSSVYSTNMNGGGIRTILSHGLIVPEGFAIDYIANNLYITDSGLRQVLACKTDGTMCHVLHDTNIEKPRSIVLDLNEGLMYWSDWSDEFHGIYRSGMDGSQRISVVSSRIGWPNGIAIDQTTKRLYWVDAKRNTLEFITLDGSLRKEISSTIWHPYSLAVFEDTIYWSDLQTSSVESCNKFTGHQQLALVHQKSRAFLGIHVYHPVLTAKVTNPCESSNCSHMCLISPVKGFRCACPYGFRLASENKTCLKEEDVGSIFVNEGSKVFYVHPKPVGGEVMEELTLSLGHAMITRVSYDSKSRHLFIADTAKPAILTINMTSLHMQELVTDVLSPEDLDFDWMSDNLYWVDSSKRTVEVINIHLLRRVIVLEDLVPPVALVVDPVRGLMFIATKGITASVIMSGMDGKNVKVLNAIRGMPLSLALHPSKSILYWGDPRAGTISYANYSSFSAEHLVTSGVDGIMSLAVSDECIFWTTRKRELNVRKGYETYEIHLPGQDTESVIRRVTYSPNMTAGSSRCLTDNGGCSYICLTSQTERTCACSPNVTLAEDKVTCVAGNRCSVGDFHCKNGRCILRQWRCDHRDDCGDDSDEKDCPSYAACAKDELICLSGECIPLIWRCDGESDCQDSSDEANCNATICDSESEVRCDNGQCLPVTWVCDGKKDCVGGSDERDCGKAKGCSFQEFQCVSDEACVDEVLKCNGKVDCEDASDEKNCSHVKVECKRGMFLCEDGSCIYDNEVCDSHSDCPNEEDEMNCTNINCQPMEMLCSSGRCINRKWICDGDLDCPDGSDELNCNENLTPLPKLLTAKKCKENEFSCEEGLCIPAHLKCDGSKQCNGGSDEVGCANKCEENEFRCEDGLCIPSELRCDGSKQCNDWSDEVNCGTCEVCQSGMYRCKDGTCVNNYQVCDGIKDCSNNEDELNCNYYTHSETD